MNRTRTRTGICEILKFKMEKNSTGFWIQKSDVFLETLAKNFDYQKYSMQILWFFTIWISWHWTSNCLVWCQGAGHSSCDFCNPSSGSMCQFTTMSMLQSTTT